MMADFLFMSKPDEPQRYIIIHSIIILTYIYVLSKDV